MGKPVCPVADTIERLSGIISEGKLKHARCRQRAEEILKLLEDVSSGGGGTDHIPTMEALASALEKEGPDDVCRSTGAMLISVLAEHREIFKSHLDTHICPVTDCARLIPSPCQMACPAGIDVPSYVTLIGQGHDGEAIALIRKDNPFPWVCGLICTNPCEFMCARGRVDNPISIKYLKGFAAERAMSDGLYKNPDKAPPRNRKVCIVGAGPAGMTAAFFLALKGYWVTVLDALPVAGGMMMVGIPRYRLPREVIDREVGMIEELGVEFRLNTRLGKDVTFNQLKAEGFEAFLIAIGAHSAHKIGIQGEDDYPQVVDAISYLRRVALGDRRKPGARVAVLGGGNTAIDAARTSLRLGCEAVTIIYRRSRSDMPANEEEVEQAEEERIDFSFLTVPVEIRGQDGSVTSIRCVRTELGPEDQSGRRRPVPIEDSDFEIQVDAVISAIGQRVDPKGFESLDGLHWTRRDTIKTDAMSMETSIPGFFAAGDAVVGPATVVEAIGGGKRAADAIDRYLSGIPQPRMPIVPVRRARLEFLEVPASTKMALQRPQMSMLNDERRRVTFQQVELGYSENAVREEARRCLRCDVCIRCGTCMDVCRNKMGIDALKLGYLSFDHQEPTDFRVTAERCILCGACASNCPTEAIRMLDVGQDRVLNLCGTILNRLKVERCEACGKVIGPERYHDYIAKRVRGIGSRLKKGLLCLDCARETTARRHAEITPPKLTM